MIRTGSPAHTTYLADLLYVSPQWVRDNAADITQTDPLGTGENDFALLHITGTTDGTSLPSSFASLHPQLAIPSVLSNTPVLIASYPAGFLQGMSIDQNLNLVSTVGTIDQVLSFKSTPPLTIDLLAVSGSIDSQQGSSGGAVVSFTDGSLLGIIVTSTLEGSTANRELRAVTYQHIEESFVRQQGESIESYLLGDLVLRAQAFNTETAPALAKLLFDQITK